QWSSEVYDSELDLVYYNYRHYSPTLGRFLSRDPIQEQGGPNLYAFVKNRPLFVNDYLGKWGWWECIKRCLGFTSTGDDISSYSLSMRAAYLGMECVRFRNKYMKECTGKDHTQYCKKLKRDWKTVCDMATEAANIARQ
ncbi:MAG: RHS repeat-associated core domain-containing protein, partial [Opitutales bacterium]|nr:RHS repeat-associated core domain-containing protein [Opitutales bacterium]